MHLLITSNQLPCVLPASADQNVFRLIIQINTHQSPCYLPGFLFPCIPTSCSRFVLPDNAHRLSSQLLNLCVHGTSRREQHCSTVNQCDQYIGNSFPSGPSSSAHTAQGCPFRACAKRHTCNACSTSQPSSPCTSTIPPSTPRRGPSAAPSWRASFGACPWRTTCSPSEQTLRGCCCRRPAECEGGTGHFDCMKQSHQCCHNNFYQAKHPAYSHR